MFHTQPPAVTPLRLLCFILIRVSPHFKSNSPSLTPAAPAPVAACHSEFQMAPIFPLMARRSGRQHIGEGGPTHAACSRGSIRGERGTNEWERRGEERRISRSAVFFSFLFFSFFFVLSQRLPSHPGHRGLVGLFCLCLDADDADLPCPATASRPAMSPLL